MRNAGIPHAPFCAHVRGRSHPGLAFKRVRSQPRQHELNALTMPSAEGAPVLGYGFEMKVKLLKV
jgi:hypothetical protein